jgi:hypothetical protein
MLIGGFPSTRGIGHLIDFPVCCSLLAAAVQALLAFATLYVQEQRITPDCMPLPLQQPPCSQAEMKAAEELFRVYDLYLWLAGRVGHGVFRGRKQVQRQRAQVRAFVLKKWEEMMCICGAACI